MRTGLYLHIPFCVRKCPYCDFYSLPFSDEASDAYVEALLRAMKQFHEETPPFDTLYLGGGTPSLLGVTRLTRLLEEAASSFGLDGSSEITLEANPGTVSPEALASLRKSGYNRISFGVQSGVESELSALGRIHAAKEAEEAILAAHSAGFDNISADLMLAIPGQTPESLRDSISFLTALPVSHISAYLLKVEEGTPFYAQKKVLSLPDDDSAASLYMICCEELERAGFLQYEISNFALSGRASRHNLGYWRCEPYLGLGPSAHSFLGGRRRFFGRNLRAFTTEDNPLSLWEDDGPGGGAEERLMLGLRLMEGIDASSLDIANPKLLLKQAGQLASKGLCRVDGSRIILTKEGFLLSNSVIVSLLGALESAKKQDE